MAQKLLKQFVFEVKVLDEQNRIIEMVGATEDFDRAGDRMLMSGVIIDNYLKNPIILPNHDRGSQSIGKAIDVKVVGSKLVFKIQFADTELGREWFYLYANKYMNASSIGFIGLEYTPNNQGGYDYTKWELLELSLVTVPCNPNAIQRALTEGHISKALFNLIKNESEVEDMGKEELEALISKSIENKVKDLEKKHTETLAAKVKEIEGLNAKIKELEGVTTKSGASLSKATVATLTKACEGITSHVKSISDMCNNINTQGTDGDGDQGDTAKDYSDEEIQKLVEENIEKILKEAE